jgi:DNA-binding CsgD family transcriptional regulator
MKMTIFYNFALHRDSSNDFNASVPANNQHQSSWFSPEICEEWLSTDTPDRILIDRQGRVLWCHITVASRACVPNGSVALSKITVGATLPAHFLLPILNAGSEAKNGVSRVALIEDAYSRGRAMVRVAALGAPGSGPLGITFCSYRQIGESARLDLKRLWDLSAAEVRVLSITFQGMTVQEVADLVDLSVETVRTHIRHIYTKVGVSSREALFAAIGPLFS